MSNKVFVFGCGCRKSNYLINHHNGNSVGKFCPGCFDPKQKYGSRHNQRCRILRVETACETCGVKIVKQSHGLGNTKHFFCPKCRYKHESKVRQARYDKKKLKDALNSANPPVCVDGKIVVTCPRCGKTTLKPALTVYGHVQPTRQYCSWCRQVADRYTDGDNAIFNSDVACVAGKAVAV